MLLKKYILLYFFLIASNLFALNLFSQSIPAIIINNGSKYTRDKSGKVDLRLNMPKAGQMIISNKSDFSDGIWENYAPLKNWQLDQSEGEKNVYVKFKDQGNKESGAFSASIVLDRIPPMEGSININNNEKYCSDPLKKVKLEISAKGSDFILISNDTITSGERWLPYVTSMEYFLLGNDGQKTVFVKFKDKAGNESFWIKDDIILDRTPPTVTAFKINDGATTTNHEVVKLTINADGASEMLLKEPNASWQPFRSEIKDFKLIGEDGVKALSVKLKDEAGNVSNVFTTQIKLDRTPPKNPKILINNNESYTSDPSKKVSIKLYAEEAMELMLSEDSTFSGVSWESYKTAVNWTLKGEDGNKKVYAKFKDETGNISAVVFDEIVLDRSSPEDGTITINKGQVVTNKKDVLLQLQSKEAKEMLISNNQSFLGALWEKFIPEKKVDLVGGDGDKWIFVKYKDAAGNVSKPLSANIVLDRIPPTDIGIKINNGLGYTTDPDNKVVVSLKASGASEMMVSNTNDFKGAVWQPFQEKLDWRLEGNDGLKVVGVKFKDPAGNESGVVTAKIKLAKSATVTGKFNINSDSLYTKNPFKRVDLNISAEGAKDMMMSNHPDFKEGVWEDFNSHKIWTLSEGDGEKTVYLKFKGFVGNESKVYSDKIILDRTPPLNGKITINSDSTFTVNKKNQVKLTLSAEEATHMMISNNPVFNNAVWEPFKTYKTWVLEKEEGVKHVYVKYKDIVGNETDVISDRILLDKTPPQNVGLKINNGAEYANNPKKAVTLVMVEEGASEMRISNSPNIEAAPWEKISNKKLNWILPGDDGEKRVYIQYMDESKNVSEVVFDKIILDRTPPKNCSFTANNDSLFTNNPDVRLFISGEDAYSLLISNRKDFFGARWEAFKKYKAHWILDGEDGEKTIYMLFKDVAGNIYPDTITHNIILDRTPPHHISVGIKGNDKIIPGKSVNLHFKAIEAEKMEIRNQRELPGEWELFKEIREWPIPETEGERNIWVRFMDRAGNVTEFFEVIRSQ